MPDRRVTRISTKTGPVPCRLLVILAREAPVGVIFRRGPSRRVELIQWHTDTDRFEREQWFKGRINEYCLVDGQSGRGMPFEAAFWADWDQQGRLVFTRQGKVFAGDLDERGRMVPRELADFNADTFEPREAPVWAREW